MRKSKTVANTKRGMELHEYLVSRTEVNPITGCWEWINKDPSGWSRTSHKAIGGFKVGKSAWLCFFGPVPMNCDVCHECDNGHCANPMHLYVAPRRQNIRDCVIRGRHNLAKLSDIDIADIRQMRKDGDFYHVIARKYKVHKETIRKAVLGKTWGYV